MATTRGIQGVNPSYFAGMTEVALDPKAGKQNPQYAQMLSQAMQNQAAATDRRRESDEDNAFKATDRKQQALRDIRSNEINKRNAAVNEAGEQRLQKGQEFEQDRLKTADTGKLLEALQTAKQNKDDAAVEYFTDELIRRGYKGRSIQETDERFNERMPAPPPAPPPAAAKPPIDRTPVGPRPGPPPPTASFPPAGEAEAAPPMKAVPAGPSPRATASFPPTSGAPPPGPAPAQAPPAAAPPAARAPTSPTEGIPFIKNVQNMDWIEGKQPPLAMPPRPVPPGPADSAQFYQDMEWHPPTEKELLDRAIADVVARESGALAAPPTVTPPVPTRPLLPGKALGRAQ